MKPGYKTTEFLITVLTTIGALVAALAGALPAKWAAIAAGIAQAAYAISRGLAKNSTPAP